MMTPGDLGHMDEEGRLFIDSREDDMIISGGENVYPGEVEAGRCARHPDVDEVAVVMGVEDEQFGQRLVAFVVPRPGSELTSEDVIEFATREPGPLQGPARGACCAMTLPRNALGKVLRRELRPSCIDAESSMKRRRRRLADKAALITGGSSGIGLAVARALGEDGYGVTIAARRPDKLEAAAAGLRDDGHRRAPRGREHGRGGRHQAHGVGARAALRAHGRPDEQRRPRHRRGDRGLRHEEARHAARRQPARRLHHDARIDPDAEARPGADGGALIVNTASIAGKHPQGWLAAYSATKAARDRADGGDGEGACDRRRALHGDLPGFVDTPMTEWIKGQVAPEDMIRPEDIAEVVRCLLRLSPACIIPEVMMVRPGRGDGTAQV